MLSIVADVVKYSETHFSAKKQGQKSLFDFGEDQGSQDTETSQDAHPSWLGEAGKLCPITLESLEEERKLTGMYLTGHPMDFSKPTVNDSVKQLSRTRQNSRQSAAKTRSSSWRFSRAEILASPKKTKNHERL